ncbi:FAD-dependent oxidoreductase [Georgenia subflava]|uniref:Fused response regulator/thioredoxin-disulfide reductase n=1 Tax=Georgenia subflava TaxID=1622177 RepID=A0A6N7ELY5_9MICO|nr:FAD-dependent oxidoreductase [Georgenia subflava]MPV36264.1 fused response regulator/thioredoxin-disulfide reductase [Georgenia subflava]
MTTHHHPEPSALPVLVVVDADDAARRSSEEALERRFSPDYRVVGAASAAAGLHLLEALATEGADVALVAADLHLPGGGVELLQQAHALHRGAGRVLLFAMDQHHTRIPFGELETLQRATALGLIDFQVAKGWVDPEEWFYPQVQEWLSGWTKAHRPHYVIYRVVGDRWTPRTHRLLDLLSRNSVPFDFVAADSPEGRELIDRHGLDAAQLPAAVHQNGSVLVDPSLGDLAVTHGISTRPEAKTYDLAILGAGPAGLAAAVYGASEGLRTVVVEPQAIGGQAGTSSMIRNYLGFTRGIGGGALAHRAWEQAILFGAEFVFSHPATGVAVRGDQRVVRLADGGEVTAGAVIVATGVTYRRLEIPALERLLGAGVYYGAAGVEAPAVAGRHVFVVGGANSAGQAAVHLAGSAARVTILVRGESLATSMSAYLIRQIEATANIDVRTRTRVSDARGETRLEGLTVEDLRTGRHEEVEAAALFVLIGAEPHTDWLRDVVALDEGGFVMTDRDLPPSSRQQPRPAWPFETSLPGVFAAGDVRHGSVKRVAGAVGEGSVAVGAVHQYLAELVPVEASRRA